MGRSDTPPLNATCLGVGYSCARCMNPCCCEGLVCDRSGPPKCEKPKMVAKPAPTFPTMLAKPSCGQHTSMKWSRTGIVSMFVHDVATNKQLWTGELPPPYNKSKAASSGDDNSEVFPVSLYSPRGAPPVVASRQWATFRDARWV